jgi:hypothetical protein
MQAETENKNITKLSFAVLNVTKSCNIDDLHAFGNLFEYFRDF